MSKNSTTNGGTPYERDRAAIERAEQEWAETWLSGVASGSQSMSQRRLSSVESRPGGLSTAAAIAKAKGVHLAVLTDDRGIEVVIASRDPIRVIC